MDDSSEFEKQWRNDGARIIAGLDQSLTEARGEYEHLNPAERKSFRAWIEKIVDIGEAKGVHIHAGAVIQLLIPKGEGDVEGVIVSAKSLQRAIEKWDAKKAYLPNMGDI